MSTDGSVSTSSSGIRQFGLYRTIDARTEEFLRLSRKRQIRQGCACAAVSTAITVTVVISVILIYEYSVIYESSSKTSMKQNWHSVMNKSAEAIPFDANLNKAKINLDPMYLNFLPLILKTLKKNKYFDNILEDDSTQSPLFGKGENPEDLFTKDTFSDSSNWMQIPASRLYTIEYKTSPIVYFKYPTRNVDHFTKIRRIRDYQRIMNYVDKMISDKVAFPSTMPMVKNGYSFHKKSTPITYTTPMPKVASYVTEKKIVFKKLNPLKKASTSVKNKSKCLCPKDLSLLLIKLIRSLQKILPDFIGSEQANACHENILKTNKILTQELEETTKIYQSKEIVNIIETDFNNNNLKSTKTKNYSDVSVPVTNALEIPKVQFISTSSNDQTVKPNTISKTFYSVNPEVDNRLSTMIKLIKPEFNNIQEDTKNSSHTITTRRFTVDTDANYYSPERTTKPTTDGITTRQFTEGPDASYYFPERSTKPTPHIITTRQFIEATDTNYYFPEITTKPTSHNITTRQFIKSTDANYYFLESTIKPSPHIITTRQFIEGTDGNYYFPERTTKPMSKVLPKVETSSNTLTVRDLILQRSKLNETTKSLPTFPTISDIEYEDYYNMSPDFVNHFGALDVQSIELPKNKMPVVNTKIKKSNAEKELDAFKTRLNPEYNNNTWNFMKKMGILAFSTTMFKNNSNETNLKTINNINAEIITEKKEADSNTESMSNRRSVQSHISKFQPEQQIKSEDVTLEEETDKLSSEEISPEDNMKSLENMLRKINESAVFNKTSTEKTEIETSKLDQHSSTQIREHVDMSCKDSKSMIPQNRPSYLEIQRNDWKRDDVHQNYDYGINFF